MVFVNNYRGYDLHMEKNRGGRPYAVNPDSAKLRNTIADLVIGGARAGEPAAKAIVQTVVKALRREEEQ